MISKEEIFYQVNKTISSVTKIDDKVSYIQKKITLQPEEAKVLLSHGIEVYREEITQTNGTKFSRLFCYVTLEQLIKASK